MSTVLVTGGAGYIGSHACKALAAAGFTPVVFDNLLHGHEWAIRWGPWKHGDLLDRTALDVAFDTHRPAAVMHFAALAYVGESVEDPAKYYRNNVAGTLNLLDCMRRHGVDRFVFSSTCATYGAAARVPITEDLVQAPINPYGRSKWMIEQVLDDYGRAYGIRSISLRYFNAAGADPDGEIGELHEPETHLIPLVLQTAAGHRSEITVFGDDYPTSDGTCVRDYVHVSDLADAHVLALRALEDDSDSTAFNLGNGAGFSVSEVIETCRRVTRANIPVRLGPRRPGDPAVLVGDSSRIASVLGWRPRFPELEEIVRSAWRWQTENEHLPR